METPFKILLADDHVMFRRGIRSMIQGMHNVEVVGEADDGPEDVAFLAQKLAHLRVFAGDGRLMHLSLLDLKAEVLLVSQFTILGDCRKGRRPSFEAAATPETAEKLYEDLVRVMAGYGLRVATGRFRQMMDVGLVNDGPVTLLLDSKKVF